LRHLGNTTNSTPFGYPRRPELSGDVSYEDIQTDHNQWKSDLLRWAQVFEESALSDGLIFDPDWKDKPIQEMADEERRRYQARTEALKEMAPWWNSLWD
jgi:hypothetical protein